MAENSAKKQRGKPFEKGQSGNPRGKPKGARHRTTILAEKLMADDAEAVVTAVIEAAKSGDMQAARIILDRICPPRKDSPLTFALPKIESAADAANAMSAIIVAVAAGEMSPGEATEIARLIESFTKARELGELEARLAALEAERKQA